MEKATSVFLTFFILITVLQAQQIEINRIISMPDFPQPYLMRDWKEVTAGYDSLVFDKDMSGQYLPLVFFRQESVNYPEIQSFGLHTAVGTLSPASGEAINVIPAVVGASLVGIDKTQQFNENWVMMIREYFNRRPEENIYLNHPQASSGFDWWYETMPNIFFMQLMNLYPDIAIFQEQLPVVANQWIRAVRHMGGSDTPWNVPYMNYRAWNMSEMEPLDQGVKQPEAAGALAWILYHAWVETGDREFLKGAEWTMEFLDNWESNPSYELQLPYGVYTAARMNAELGTNYDIEKMLNWTFDRGELRGWGAISGNWGGYDCFGLIGEANDNGNDYAFMMNGYQQAAALVPMVRYDHRFAAAIAKWVLNMANASRLFYSEYLPASMQDNNNWSQTYDPDSYIGYEALREVKNGQSPYATGDAIDGGWALTNLMLYGSSHVGYLASIVDTTNVEGILRLDLLKTDFFRQDAFQTYLYYNPFESVKTIEMPLSEGSYKIYDAISKTFLAENQSETFSVVIPAKDVVMPVIVPQDADISFQGSKTMANDVIIDFQNGQDTGALPPRIKALAVEDTIVVTGGSVTAYTTALDPQNTSLTYMWTFSDNIFVGQDQETFTMPQQQGIYELRCKVTNTMGLSDSLSIVIHVVEKVPYPPQINALVAVPRKVRPGETLQMICTAEDFYNDPLTYTWFSDHGSVSGDGNEVTYTAPATEGNYYIKCEVINPDGLSTTDSVLVMIRNFPEEGSGALIAQYPLHGNANDISGNELHGNAGGGITWTTDQNGIEGSAAAFNGQTAFISLPGSPLFDFTGAMSISMFLNVAGHTSSEQHPVSHGSWENRYKISVSNQKIRFTLHTDIAIRDLDSETQVQAGRWYHVAVVYNGNDMEIWIDGHLDAFTGHKGAIGLSPVNPVLGQNLPGNNNFNFKGAMSMLHFYDYALSPMQITENYSLDAETLPIRWSDDLLIYPNPNNGKVFSIRGHFNPSETYRWEVMDVSGKMKFKGQFQSSAFTDPVIRLPGTLLQGIYLIRVYGNQRTFSSTFIIYGR